MTDIEQRQRVRLAALRTRYRATYGAEREPSDLPMDAREKARLMASQRLIPRKRVTS